LSPPVEQPAVAMSATEAHATPIYFHAEFIKDSLRRY
jgi:hypothetical protein